MKRPKHRQRLKRQRRLIGMWRVVVLCGVAYRVRVRPLVVNGGIVLYALR